MIKSLNPVQVLSGKEMQTCVTLKPEYLQNPELPTPPDLTLPPKAGEIPTPGQSRGSATLLPATLEAHHPLQSKSTPEILPGATAKYMASSIGSSSAWGKPRPRSTFCELKRSLEWRGGEWLGHGSSALQEESWGRGGSSQKPGSPSEGASLSPLHLSLLPIIFQTTGKMGFPVPLPTLTVPIPREKASL